MRYFIVHHCEVDRSRDLVYRHIIYVVKKSEHVTSDDFHSCYRSMVEKVTEISRAKFLILCAKRHINKRLFMKGTGICLLRTFNKY